MELQQTGYGAGSRQYDKFPNALRVLIGDDEVQAKVLKACG